MKMPPTDGPLRRRKDPGIDGIDQTDLLMGKTETGRKTFYFDRAGIRFGKWKYLRAKAHFYGYAREDDRPEAEELYNLKKDIGERENLAEKHPALKTIDGVLANPELVGSRFHNCPVGWGCRIVNYNLKIVYQLEAKGIEVFDHGFGANLRASIAAAFANNEPWFGYYWGPTAVLGKHEMTRVDIGDVDPVQHAINQSPDSPEDKLAPSGFPSAPVLNVVTADLAKREPEVFKFIQNMSFPNDIISKMLAWKEANNASASEAAAWILTNHKDVILSWVNEDAKAKLNKLL